MSSLADDYYKKLLEEGYTGSISDMLKQYSELGSPTNIEIGDVETLPSGAEAYLRMRGTAPNLILDAGLVSGADGSGGGDSQVYFRPLLPEDTSEGWQSQLYFVRTGNTVTILGYFGGVEGVSTEVVTEKIPMGYRPIGSLGAPLTALLIDDSGTPITTTPTLVMAGGSTLSFPLEDYQAGVYYPSSAVYVTLDDPPESDAMETYNLSMLSNLESLTVNKITSK